MYRQLVMYFGICNSLWFCSLVFLNGVGGGLLGTEPMRTLVIDIVLCCGLAWRAEDFVMQANNGGFMRTPAAKALIATGKQLMFATI
jgi:hypothetical protein